MKIYTNEFGHMTNMAGQRSRSLFDLGQRSLRFQAGPRSAIGRAPDWFDTRSGNILSFLLPLFQEGQLSVTGETCARSTG